MDKERLKELVQKMKDYLDENNDFGIHMESAYLYEPDRGKPYKICGCHAGFISAVFGESGEKWLYGAKFLSNFLGFGTYEKLPKWAQKNPDIWGNEEGIYLFSDSVAFGLGDTIFSAEKIVEHWEGVLDRLETGI